MSQTAVVIDLMKYRERKAEERRAAEAAAAASCGAAHVPVPFMMPMFFMVWPTWVFSPQPAYAWNEGGSGAA